MENNKRIFSEEEITQIVKDAMDFFSDSVDFSISLKNTKLAFFTLQNGKAVYETFCDLYFPNWEHKAIQDLRYFESFAAQAFVGEKYYGILIRTDIPYTPTYLFKIIMHEIAHIFCIIKEFGGKNFYDRFCGENSEKDGLICAGYAIWRELIADILSEAIMSDTTKYSLKDVKVYVTSQYKKIRYGNPESKQIVSDILLALFNTQELATVSSWEEAENSLKKAVRFSCDEMYRIVELVHRKLNSNPFWEITHDFVRDLGNAYIMLLARIELGPQ